MSGLKILILSNLCPPFWIGGYEIGCANVAAGLYTAGHNIRLATCRSHVPGPPDPIYIDRCFNLQWYQPTSVVDEVVRYPLFHAAVSDYDNSLELLRLLRSFAPDVVYLWNIWGIGGIALLDLLNTLDVPWVLHLMDNLPHHLIAGGPEHVRSIFGGSISDLFSRGRVISISQRLLDEIFEDVHMTFDGDLEIVPGWVDSRVLPGDFENCRGSGTRFVSAGRVCTEKGIELILEAAALLSRQGIREFNVDIFGAGELPSFIDMAQRLGVNNIVRFLGPRAQAELIPLYSGYHGFLFPTWEREPFGFAPIEAAATGCIPVVTRQCGAAERLVDLVHCLKIDRTAEELALAMRRIVERTVDLPALARRAANMVRHDLGFDRALGRVIDILNAASRDWNKKSAHEDWVPLLIHAKHYLAYAMMFGEE
jgi:glycogen synthase